MNPRLHCHQQVSYPDFKKSKKETSELNYAIDQIRLADSYKAFHPMTTRYMYFLVVQGMFPKIDHILGTQRKSYEVQKY